MRLWNRVFKAKSRTEQSHPNTLHMVLHESADTTVSDEQVRRILEPVLDKIESGAFDRSYWNANGMRERVYKKARVRSWEVAAIAAAVFVFAITTTVMVLAFRVDSPSPDMQDYIMYSIVDIPDTSIPLAGAIPTAFMFDGELSPSAGKEKDSYMLNLINVDSMALSHSVPLCSDGAYAIEKVKEGTYLVVVSPVGFEPGMQVYIRGTWVVADGKAQESSAVDPGVVSVALGLLG